MQMAIDVVIKTGSGVALIALGMCKTAQPSVLLTPASFYRFPYARCTKNGYSR